MRVEPVAAVRGAIAVPGVKGISQRAVLLGAVADGESRIRGFGRAADTESAIHVARALGAQVDEDGDEVTVHGVGLRGLRAPAGTIDCGNAGTVLRLVSGLLAGQTGTFELVGDESLSARPHERVAEPLRQMGADVQTTDGHAPVRITGSRLRPIRYELPVASAQVKSAVLLAGLLAETGPTTVVEPVPTRDHTERLLSGLGVRVARGAHEVSVWPVDRLPPLELDIPGEFSSAAPFVVAAALLSESELVVQGVNVNSTRTGLLAVLGRMGARVTVFNRRTVGGEPVAAFARGTTDVRGAEELCHKETDRIAAVVEELQRLGVRAHARPDGFTVTGVPSRPRGGRLDARGDHRMAMLGAIAGLVSRDGVEIEGAESVAISFPGFFDLLESITHR